MVHLQLRHIAKYAELYFSRKNPFYLPGDNHFHLSAFEIPHSIQLLIKLSIILVILPHALFYCGLNIVSFAVQWKPRYNIWK